MEARIYYNYYQREDYCGEGSYILVTEENRVVAQHICTNRSFANLDLTHRIKDILSKHNITEVYSNGDLVWSKDLETAKEKRFVCIMSGRGSILCVYKEFKTEQEARQYLDNEGRYVVLFDDDELVACSSEELQDI